MKYQIAIKLLVAILAVVTNKNIARAGDTVIGVKTERSALSTLRSMLSEFKPEDLRQVKFVSGPAPTPTPFPTCTSTPSKDTYTCRTFSYNRGEGKDEKLIGEYEIKAECEVPFTTGTDFSKILWTVTRSKELVIVKGKKTGGQIVYNSSIPLSERGINIIDYDTKHVVRCDHSKHKIDAGTNDAFLEEIHRTKKLSLEMSDLLEKFQRLESIQKRDPKSMISITPIYSKEFFKWLTTPKGEQISRIGDAR